MKTPAWTRALSAVDANVDDDVKLLREKLNPEALDAKHPLRVKWEAQNPDSEDRFDFQHLADDIRQTIGVPGFGSLRRQLIGNTSDFQNFRYELRIAGSLARTAGQSLLSLGGDKTGPDIEVKVLSGHRCGIACFRSADVPPSLEQAPPMLLEVVKSAAEEIRNALGDVDATLDLAIPVFPLTREACTEACRLLVASWKRPDIACFLSQAGASVTRQAYPEPAQRGTRRIRIKVRIPVPLGEKRRIAGKIVEKIQKEERWASKYEGVPVFVFEESRFGILVDANDIREALNDQSHSFVGFLCTRAWFQDNIDGTGRHLFEHIGPIWRNPVGLNIGMETFGNNLTSWGEGHATIFMDPPRYAIIEWDVAISDSVTTITTIREISASHRIERVPLGADGKIPADPDSIARLAEVIGRLRQYKDG